MFLCFCFYNLSFFFSFGDGIWVRVRSASKERLFGAPKQCSSCYLNHTLLRDLHIFAMNLASIRGGNRIRALLHEYRIISHVKADNVKGPKNGFLL